MSFFRLMLMKPGTIVWKPHQRKKMSVKTSYSQGQGEANKETEITMQICNKEICSNHEHKYLRTDKHYKNE